MSLLLIKNDGIGDLILSSGLIADLARERGPVDLVTCSANREIAENIPGLRRCLYVSRDAIQYHPRLLRWGIRWRRQEPEDAAVFRHLTHETYDTAVCLRRYIRQNSLLLMAKVRARRRLCAWRWCSNASLPLAEKLSAGWERYSGAGDAHSELTYFREFLRETMGLQSTCGPGLECASGIQPTPERHRVGLCLSGPFKNWPAQNWIALADALVKEGNQLVLFGGADAVELGNELQARHLGTVNWINRLSFAASGPEIARLELLVSNDTGFAHYASLMTHRIVVIMGGGTYDHFLPWPQTGNQFVLAHGLNCWGCNWHCHHPLMECFHRIEPSEVLNYIRFIRRGEVSPGLHDVSVKQGCSVPITSAAAGSVAGQTNQFHPVC